MFFLKSSWLTNESSSICNLKNFIEKVVIDVGNSDDKGSLSFSLDIIGLEWFLAFISNEEDNIFLKHSLILKNLDEKLIKHFIEKQIQRCNLSNKSAFDCLTRCFEYESEEWLYFDNVDCKYIHENAQWDFLIDYPKVLNEEDDWINFNKEIYLNLTDKTSKKSYKFRFFAVSPLWIQTKFKKDDYFYVRYAIVSKYFDYKIIENHVQSIFKKLDYTRNKFFINCLSYYFEIINE